jgi:hypothetical protein
MIRGTNLVANVISSEADQPLDVSKARQDLRFSTRTPGRHCDSPTLVPTTATRHVETARQERLVT